MKNINDATPDDWTEIHGAILRDLDTPDGPKVYKLKNPDEFYCLYDNCNCHTKHDCSQHPEAY